MGVPLRREKGDCTVYFGVAGIGIEIKCNDPWLADQLSARYQDFPLDGSIHLSLSVLWDGNEPLHMANPQVTFSDESVQVHDHRLVGIIQEKLQRASLTFSSQNPIQVVEYFIRVVFAILSFEIGGLLFHGAGIVRDDRTYVFFGPSGSGKTTIAMLSPRDVVLNDDLLLFIPKEGSWWVYATPFWSPEQVAPTSKKAVLVAMFRLVKDHQVFVERLGQGLALAEVLSNIPVISMDAKRSASLVERASQLVASIPVYRLHFLPDDSFWEVIDRC